MSVESNPALLQSPDRKGASLRRRVTRVAWASVAGAAAIMAVLIFVAYRQLGVLHGQIEGKKAQLTELEIRYNLLDTNYRELETSFNQVRYLLSVLPTEPAKETIPVKGAPPAKGVIAPKEAIPVNGAPPAKGAIAAKETTPVKGAPPAKGAIASKETTPVKGAPPTKGAIASKEAIPVKGDLRAKGAIAANAASKLPPRVYLDIANESQRPKAEITAVRLRSVGYIVPKMGILVVGSLAPKSTQLRYFRRSDEQGPDLPGILKTLQQSNVDARPQYVTPNTPSAVPPGQFELWFGTGG